MPLSRKKLRTTIPQENGVNLYKFNSKIPEKVNSLIDEYKKLIHEIVNSAPKERNQVRQNNEARIRKIKSTLDKLQMHCTGSLKNVLSQSSDKNTLIGTGQDSYVYSLGNGYVYKEGKEGNERNTEYLQKKYKILKLYLGDIIPKSYFFYGESIESVDMKGMHHYKYFPKRTITLQKEIGTSEFTGINAQKMSGEMRTNEDFLHKLEKAHRKYILLKFFIQSICQENGFHKKVFDTQLDLGPISKIDNLHIDNTEFVEEKVTSPNIMWDGKNVSFIDFGYGEWDEKKETIYQILLNPSTTKKWNDICKNMGL